MIGQTLSHYEVLERIGEGGMGVVYKARDTLLGRLVALKTLPAGGPADPEQRARLLREARAASALRHPNIIDVYDLLHHDGSDVIVMELVTGWTLDRAVAGKPLREVLGYARQIADALAKAHAAGIVHRDLKPSNVMVDESRTVRILDFGLARHGAPVGTVDFGGDSARPTAAATGTAEGRVVGTLAYMSPEQAEGKRADARSDVFSFGAVLYEMVTGRMAFRGDSAAATLAAVLERDPQPPRELVPGLPPDLGKLIQRCLRKDPAKRFQSMGDVALDLEEIAAGLDQAPPPATKPRARRRRLLRLAATAAALALFGLPLALNVGGLRDRLQGEVGPRNIHSIAVLSLKNLSGDPEQEYFSDGMTEVLIAELAKIEALRVISRQSVVQFKRSEQPLPEIARMLNVDALVEGSVQRSGDRVRITIRLLQAGPEQLLWAESYDRDLRSILRLQGVLAREISRAVQATVTPAEEARLTGAEAVDPEAHDAYLKGLYFFSVSHDKATEYLRQALEVDPGYAAAHAKLAECHVLDGILARRPPKQAFADAETAARRALELDDSLAEAHTALAEVSAHRDWDWTAAERQLSHALSLKPSYAIGRFRHSGHLVAMGRFQEGIARARRAQALIPGPFSFAYLAVYLYNARRYDESIAEAQKALELDPEHTWALRVLGQSYSLKGMHEEALAALQKAHALAPDDPSPKANLGRAYALAGHRERARQLLQELRSASTLSRAQPFDRAGLLAALGEKDEALDVLEGALEERQGQVIWLNVEPRLDPLRDDPRFQGLVRRLNLPDA